MFNDLKPKDVAILIITFTLCAVIIMTTIGIIFLQHDTGGKMEQILAFIFGSITTMVGEYILLDVKRKKDK